MKRHIAAALSIFAVAATVGWKLASHPETSAGLQEISLNQRSEHSNPEAVSSLARIRVRVMASDFKVNADQKVPQISLAAE